LRTRSVGKGEYVGGFLTTTAPPDDPVAGSVISDQPISTRREAGKVAAVADLEELGTVLQVLNATPYPSNPGGQVVVMPGQRIRRTEIVEEPSAEEGGAPLASLNVEYPVVIIP
jgi:hypothetical protein